MNPSPPAFDQILLSTIHGPKRAKIFLCRYSINTNNHLHWNHILSYAISSLCPLFDPAISSPGAAGYKDINGTKKIMASTQFESLDARRAFPCWDEPAQKDRWFTPGVGSDVPFSWFVSHHLQMVVSWNRGTPKSSILVGFSLINHPFWGTPISGNTQVSIGNYIPSSWVMFKKGTFFPSHMFTHETCELESKHPNIERATWRCSFTVDLTWLICRFLGMKDEDLLICRDLLMLFRWTAALGSVSSFKFGRLGTLQHLNNPTIAVERGNLSWTHVNNPSHLTLTIAPK